MELRPWSHRCKDSGHLPSEPTLISPTHMEDVSEENVKYYFPAANKGKLQRLDLLCTVEPAQDETPHPTATSPLNPSNSAGREQLVHGEAD